MARFLFYDKINETVDDVNVQGEKVCMDIRRSVGCEFINPYLKPTHVKYAAGVRASYSKRPSDGNGELRFDGLIVENMGDPLKSYKTANNDNMALEIGNERILNKNHELRGATDACVDLKSSLEYPVLYMSANGMYGPAHRQVRVRPGGTAIFAWDTFYPATDRAVIWFYENMGEVIFHNCQFVMPSGINHSVLPKEFVSTDESTVNAVMGLIRYAKEDPFKGIDFFQNEPEAPVPDIRRKFRFTGEIEEI